MGLVKVLNYVKQCYSNEDGHVIYEEILHHFSNEEDVRISFEGVDAVTSSFVNSALVALLEDYTFQFIKTKLTFINTSKQINNLINQRFKFEVKKRSELIYN